MYTHIMVGANDMDKSRVFYDAVLGSIGIAAGSPGERAYYFKDNLTFGVVPPANGEAATFANGGTIGFTTDHQDRVDAFHAAGLANGGICEGKPGPRPMAPGNGYMSYLRDPDGNKICVYADLDKQE